MILFGDFSKEVYRRLGALFRLFDSVLWKFNLIILYSLKLIFALAKSSERSDNFELSANLFVESLSISPVLTRLYLKEFQPTVGIYLLKVFDVFISFVFDWNWIFLRVKDVWFCLFIKWSFIIGTLCLCMVFNFYDKIFYLFGKNDDHRFFSSIVGIVRFSNVDCIFSYESNLDSCNFNFDF